MPPSRCPNPDSPDERIGMICVQPVAAGSLKIRNAFPSRCPNPDSPD